MKCTLLVLALAQIAAGVDFYILKFNSKDGTCTSGYDEGYDVSCDSTPCYDACDAYGVPATTGPSSLPIPSPTPPPSISPKPTTAVTPSPTPRPTIAPTPRPTSKPTPSPSPRPTNAPSPRPTYSKAPTPRPTAYPSSPPSVSPYPTTAAPTANGMCHVAYSPTASSYYALTMDCNGIAGSTSDTTCANSDATSQQDITYGTCYDMGSYDIMVYQYTPTVSPTGDTINAGSSAGPAVALFGVMTLVAALPLLM